eukprot:364289-Chlamydomonas_euryale.AAC.14
MHSRALSPPLHPACTLGRTSPPHPPHPACTAGHCPLHTLPTQHAQQDAQKHSRAEGSTSTASAQSYNMREKGEIMSLLSLPCVHL